IFFFFSSRRRHTRLQGDWSSDVCSSDLHRRAEIVARLRDLALVADEEPGAGEDPLELLPVDLVADEDLAADDPALDVDQSLQGSRLGAGHARPPRASSVATTRRSDRRRVMVGQDAPPR